MARGDGGVDGPAAGGGHRQVAVGAEGLGGRDAATTIAFAQPRPEAEASGVGLGPVRGLGQEGASVPRVPEKSCTTPPTAPLP